MHKNKSLESRTPTLSVPDLRSMRPEKQRQNEVFSIFSSNQIGESNRRRVIQMLFDLGPTSRAELARLTDTKRTTIGGIVQPLIDSGLLVEIEPSEKGGVGKPAKPLWFSSAASCVCSVVLMPEKIEVALISITGEVAAYEAETVEPDERSRDDYANRLKRMIKAAMAQATSPVLGIGIAVGGMVDPDEGILTAVNLAPSLAGYRIKDDLTAHFGVNVVVDHHPRAILLGERWFGEGRGLSKFAVIYADEVLGCAMYLDGAPFRGPQGAGGELGHTIVDLDGRQCTCGRRGCWETIATLSWLRTRAGVMNIPHSQSLSVESLAAESEILPEAKVLLQQYAHNLAIGISNLQTLMMLDNYIIYGEARRGRKAIEDALVAELDVLSGPGPSSSIKIMTGRDQQQITLRGAAGLVISEQLEIDY